MEKFEKKYCYKNACFDVDKNLKKEHLNALNSNQNIRIVSVSGGMESPAHINFEMSPRNDLTKAESYLKKKIPNSNIECYGWSRGGYSLNKQNKDYRGKKRTPTKKICNVVSKKQKSASWWKKASSVISKLGK